MIKEIQKYYSLGSNGKKIFTRLKWLSFLISFLIMLFAFNLNIFNFEKIFLIFLFIGLGTFVLSFYITYDSAIRQYDILQEILDFEKIEKIIKEAEKEIKEET